MLDNVFTQPRLDFDDYFRREGQYSNKERCLQMFQNQQSSLDGVKPSMHLGKSEHGIYYIAIRWHQLQVWLLHEASESQPTPAWELKHKADIAPSIRQHYIREDRDEIETSWSLDRGEERPGDSVDNGWDSSDDTIVEGEDVVHYDDLYCNMSYHMDLLGYHPTKEIALLGDYFEGFAYYLGSSKLQYLGTLRPEGCLHIQVAATHDSFVYTPCMDDLLPHHKQDTTHDYFDGEYGDLQDTDEDENLQEEEVDIDKDEDQEDVSDEDFQAWEEDRDNDEEENGKEMRGKALGAMSVRERTAGDTGEPPPRTSPEGSPANVLSGRWSGRSTVQRVPSNPVFFGARSGETEIDSSYLGGLMVGGGRVVAAEDVTRRQDIGRFRSKGGETGCVWRWRHTGTSEAVARRSTEPLILVEMWRTEATGQRDLEIAGEGKGREPIRAMAALAGAAAVAVGAASSGPPPMAVSAGWLAGGDGPGGRGDGMLLDAGTRRMKGLRN
ncbi:hypothetical protein EJB05_51784 [Eragrostis curvula]|uniref:Uncharacterized protein n=1 Tax=Eragrostis curvula TaxID=38414 RepID=A0A5J9SUV9_9POAL|nr:hypothetical protein EJB05_51784 [Eragrostis curvula]